MKLSFQLKTPAKRPDFFIFRGRLKLPGKAGDID
jgi:hypothetical protein